MVQADHHEWFGRRMHIGAQRCEDPRSTPDFNIQRKPIREHSARTGRVFVAYLESPKRLGVVMDPVCGRRLAASDGDESFQILNKVQSFSKNLCLTPASPHR